MKKQYQKPMIAVEHYELTQSIASCSIKIGFLDSICVIKDSDSTPEMRDLAMNFMFTSGKCVNDAIIGSDEDGVCYHTNINAAFSS